jgi:hypothetical protein
MRELRILILPALLLCMVGRAALAQATDEPGSRLAAPLDSAALAEKLRYARRLRELQAKSPTEYETTRQAATLTVHMGLARFGYVSGPFDVNLSAALVDAIRRYERDRGLPVTGDPLTYELLLSLAADDQVLGTAPVLPSRFVTSSFGYARATGAWRFDGMGSQSIGVEISCSKQERRCVESQAILRAGTWVDQTLTSDQQEWVVDRWDEVEIATAPVDFTCARYILRINLVQQTATKVRSTISKADECSHQEKADLVIKLEDGPALAAQRVREASREKFPALLSPAAAALFDRGSGKSLP